MDTLFIIPARKGSKGLPKKNIKSLGGKPLIAYSIDFALQNATKNDIVCISTNDLKVIEIAKTDFNLDVPFIRPDALSNDTASTFDVIIHALDFYKENGLTRINEYCLEDVIVVAQLYLRFHFLDLVAPENIVKL